MALVHLAEAIKADALIAIEAEEFELLSVQAAEYWDGLLLAAESPKLLLCITHTK